MEIKFYLCILEKYSDIKFNENPSGGGTAVPCGWTDRHEVNSRFSQFCEREWAQKY
jgi:hypothetical protein